ncbi:MAG: AAA family ATPase [Lutibacter sp.]|uniref:UvrD-helicase domain-containing protein n=1 Tax=Lutibacter sp. TaxID=1925666 RepID=UPI0019E383CC|nr:UvrD-helicase domain-containing protein [Lutibacter sp.]NOR29207.1 AAA family ATPase [Lutibacter sp.]
MQHSSSFQVYNASAGSGKTFTLVKEYLKILLSSSNTYKFQQILAVTFTNKAAAEMKERVIENLYTFSNKQKNDMLPVICAEANLTVETIFKRSRFILNAILQNYSAFSITTIDSFTHKLIRTFAYDLQLPMNFEVEMDAVSLLNEAVDVVISKIGEHKELTDLLVSYSLQKLDDDKSWDISKELKDFAKIVLNETNATYLKELQNVSINEFKTLKEELQKDNKEIENQFLKIGDEGLKIISESGLEISEFAYNGELPKHFIKLAKIKQLKVDELKFDGRLNKTIEENKNLFSGKCNSASKQQIECISIDLKELYYQSKKLYNEKYKHYILNSLIVESLIPLAVLNYVNSALQDIKLENNILLNAEFNQKINDTIKNEPAPFIYERIGEKFRYYFIDEMQDTSELQWKNLIPLIDNAITSENEEGEQGKLLLVGDAKQSIYRWRGGKAEQFIALSSNEKSRKNNPFQIKKALQNLDTNYRSYSEIINFNNSFFKHISKFLNKKSFSNLFLEGNNQKTNKNEGGYVQLSFVEKQKDDDEKELVYPKKVLEIIQNLDASFEKNEVCILVRTKKQGVAVANYLSENKIEIISSETLLLQNSTKVNFIIDLLNVLQNPTNKEYKIKLLYFLFEYLKIEGQKHLFFSDFVNLTNNDFFKNLRTYNVFFNYNEFIQNPFYESIEYIIRSFQLVLESDANIQFFLDTVFEFQQKKQASIIEFLEFWELKKDSLSIVAPEAKNAVRIMTIHKAKGLEFPVVIYPYSIDIYNQINPRVWYSYQETGTINSVLVNARKKLNFTGKQGEQLFKQQREELELDNFNLLYVALTRPVEQLYIVSENNISSKNGENLSHTSGLFINFLKELNIWDADKNEYSFGDKKRNIIPKNEINKTISQTSFITNSWKNHNISIVAKSSLLWDTDQGKAIVYGNLIHEILSKIKTRNDIPEVVNQYTYKGTINTIQKNEITTILNQLVNHPKLCSYFEQNNVIYTEQEIVTSDKNIIIPDRLVINNKNVTIIDYKTGNPDKKYHEQLNKYAKALEDLNYVIEKKILVYINSKISIEEV